MKKYKTESIRWGVSPQITQFDIQKETDKYIYIGKSRTLKHSEYGIFHETYDDAVAYLKAMVDAEISLLHRRIARARAVREKIFIQAEAERAKK